MSLLALPPRSQETCPKSAMMSSETLFPIEEQDPETASGPQETSPKAAITLSDTLIPTEEQDPEDWMRDFNLWKKSRRIGPDKLKPSQRNRIRRWKLVQKLDYAKFQRGEHDKTFLYQEGFEFLTQLGFDWEEETEEEEEEEEEKLEEISEEEAEKQGDEAPPPVKKSHQMIKSEQNWAEMYEVLKEYHDEYGHADVKSTEPRWNKLYNWVKNQKKRYRQTFVLKSNSQVGRRRPLSSQELEKLSLLGFDFGQGDAAATSNVAPTSTKTGVDRNQGRRQRPALKTTVEESATPMVSITKQIQLNSAWDKMYEELKAYHRKHGHVRISPKYGGNVMKLYNWIHSQKRRYRVSISGNTGDYTRRPLSPEEKEKLLALGVDLVGESTDMAPSKIVPTTCNRASVAKANDEEEDLDEENESEEESSDTSVIVASTPEWDKMYNTLKGFRNKYGHVKVPSNNARWKKLYHWISNQKRRYRETSAGKSRAKGDKRRRPLSPEELEKLLELGLELGLPSLAVDSNTASAREEEEIEQDEEVLIKAKPEPMARLEREWEEMYQSLREYHRKNGHTNVSRKEKGHLKLFYWIATQKRRYRGLENRRPLAPEELKKLLALGVPLGPEQASLGTATGSRTVAPSKNTFAKRGGNRKTNREEEQVVTTSERSQQGGWIDERWNTMYKSLKAFHQQHGHLQIPSTDARWRKLHRWVFQQRCRFRAAKGGPNPDNRRPLTLEETEKLQSVGLLLENWR